MANSTSIMLLICDLKFEMYLDVVTDLHGHLGSDLKHYYSGTSHYSAWM